MPLPPLCFAGAATREQHLRPTPSRERYTSPPEHQGIREPHKGIIGAEYPTGNIKGPWAHVKKPVGESPWAQGRWSHAPGPWAHIKSPPWGRAHGPRADGPMDSLAHGPMDPWTHGPIGPWDPGPMGPFALGPWAVPHGPFIWTHGPFIWRVCWPYYSLVWPYYSLEGLLFHNYRYY